jgi:hypothetical protein
MGVRDELEGSPAFAAGGGLVRSAAQGQMGERAWVTCSQPRPLLHGHGLVRWPADVIRLAPRSRTFFSFLLTFCRLQLGSCFLPHFWHDSGPLGRNGEYPPQIRSATEIFLINPSDDFGVA